MDDQHLIADPEPPAKDADPKADELAPFKPANLVGRVLDGRYELKKCVGRGGMGVVYLAHQSALSRDVVVKLLPPNFADDADALARFQREARGMSKLQHPHIVSVYDFGIEDGQAYIVMEYVEGMTLRRFVREHQGPAGMRFETFGTIALQIIEGLGAAHTLGLVHRDIKPSNIMLSKRGNTPYYVKILDFGLAKLVKGAQEITRDQGLVGSVGYLSPEQILGHNNDERVDIYALGVLFYYMLAGEKPFVGDDDVAVLYQHVHQAPAPLQERVSPEQEVPQAALALIHRMLAKSPDARPANARQLLREFGECVEGTAIRSPHVSGEFRAASRSNEYPAALSTDPSTELDSGRVRRETPFSQVPPHSTATLSGLFVPGSDSFPSASGSWVSGERLLKMERQNRTRNILLGVLALLILGAAIAFLLQNNRAQNSSEVVVTEPRVELAEPEAEPAIEVQQPALAPPQEEAVEVELKVEKQPDPEVKKAEKIEIKKEKTPKIATPRVPKKPAPKPAPRPKAAEVAPPSPDPPEGGGDLLPATVPEEHDDLLMP